MIDKEKVETFEQRRLAQSLQVPFAIRAWWLREFEECPGVDWNNDLVVPTVWSNYSDPLCDVSGIDELDDL
jgi:hypothetical protein